MFFSWKKIRSITGKIPEMRYTEPSKLINLIQNINPIFNFSQKPRSSSQDLWQGQIHLPILTLPQFFNGMWSSHYDLSLCYNLNTKVAQFRKKANERYTQNIEQSSKYKKNQVTNERFKVQSKYYNIILKIHSFPEDLNLLED